MRDTWAVADRLGDVPGSFIAAALLPALIITVLFYFDHNVSSQMAQQPEFNLVKGSAYHWDFLLLSALVRAKQGAGAGWPLCKPVRLQSVRKPLLPARPASAARVVSMMLQLSCSVYPTWLAED